MVGDGIFVLSDIEKSHLGLSEVEETEIIRPYFTTEELGRYYGNPNNKNWIIYTRSDINSKNQSVSEKFENI